MLAELTVPDQSLPWVVGCGGCVWVGEGLNNRRAAELAMWGAKPKPKAQPAPPPTEPPPTAGFDPVQLAQLALPQGGGMIPMQHIGLRGKDPEYIPSAGAVGTYNGGGPVQYLRNGGRANITEEERERRRLCLLYTSPSPRDS